MTVPERRMNILLVENHDLFAQTVIEQFLGGHSVRQSRTVREAAKLAKETAFDAILVDYDLDDAKGDALVRTLRALGFRGRIVGISAKEDGNEALLRAGADSICAKSHFDRIGDHLA